MVAFGGGGGLHACEISAELGIRTVLVPAHAGVLSPLGMVLADGVRDYAAGVLGRSNLAAAFKKLLSRARRESPGAAFECTADLRYKGQSYELNVPWNPRNPAAAFHREHAQLCGYSTPGREIEIVTIRVRARRSFSKPRPRSEKRQPGKAEVRRVWTGSSWREMPAFHRAQIAHRAESGPALVLDYGSTTLVPAGWNYHVDKSGNLVIAKVSA